MKVPSKSKIAAYLQAPRPQTTAQKWFTSVLEGKLYLIVIFSVFYGLVFINYIDIIMQEEQSTATTYGSC